MIYQCMHAILKDTNYFTEINILGQTWKLKNAYLNF